MEETRTEETRTEEKTTEESPEKPIGEKTVRKKNGKKLRKIRKQMEFYFSDANLQKDKMLGQMVNSDPDAYVDLSVFLTFNKIREMTSELPDIVEALSRSEMLETNDNFTRVRRTYSFVPSDKSAKEETVYVERLPPHANLKFITNVFQRFGKVVYVNLPYYRKSGKHKGFAFVEFGSSDCAQKACEAFKQYSDDESEEEPEVKKVDDEKKEETDKEKNDTVPSMKHSRKRKKSEGNEKPVCKMSKSSALSIPQKSESHSKHHTQDRAVHVRKRKRQISEGEPSAKIRKELKASDVKKAVAKPISSCTDAKAKGTNTDCESAETIKTLDSSESENVSHVTETTDVIPTVVQNEVVTKLETADVDNVKEKDSAGEEANNNIDSKDAVLLGIEHESEMKVVDGSIEETNMEATSGKPVMEVSTEAAGEGDAVKKKRKRGAHSDDKLKLRVLSMAEWISYRNKYLTMQRKAMSAIKKMLLLDRQQRRECDALLCHASTSNEHKINEQPVGENGEEEENFQKGLILKIVISEGTTLPPLEDLRKQSKSSVENVAFVDTSVLTEYKLYMRFHNTDAALSAANNDFVNTLGLSEVLSGQEESVYWKKLEEDRIAQRNRPKVKKRGRDKIIARAAKLEERKKHIFFEK